MAQSKPRNVTAADAEFEAVLRKAPGWLKLTLLLTRYCALRATTALTLTAADINTETWHIRRRTKAQMSISIPCGPRVREMLRFALHMAEPGQYLVNALGGKGDTPGKLYENSNHAINKLKRDLKISGKWTLHDLRRTAARELYDNTRDLRLVQALLGHANLAQSLWYLSDATHTLTADHLEQGGRKVYA
ncbi:tyrosine-type recombinase/integrase [Silvibacterium acidisoli]|uniref:tyrosine-type recombinase/integrase n=1 Tax=Acidobacteriaceae bacterium ZG23-2 TaxID=2883246 RepID=UPI00406BEEB5